MPLHATSLLLIALAAAGAAGAQTPGPVPTTPGPDPVHARHPVPGHAPDPAPARGLYAGWQAREIKALSAQQQDDLQAGRGMALALAAELNGHPGPSHVLALAGPLGLLPAQLARTQALFDQMQQEARAHGEAVLAAERRLDALFGRPPVAPAALAAATTEAALALGRLRESHLRHHLEMRSLLSPEQVAAYQQLRGY